MRIIAKNSAKNFRRKLTLKILNVSNMQYKIVCLESLIRETKRIARLCYLYNIRILYNNN